MTVQVLVLFVVCSSTMAAMAAAQTLPSGPLGLAGGRIVLGAEASLAMAPEDHGFFNYSDYEHSALRELRLSLGARARVSDRLSVLADVRTENFDRLAVFGLYARLRPVPGRRLDVQAGRIPPVFGRFARESYARQGLLVGSPLAYQYLTSLRPDAIPATADELLQMRGRGWLSTFSVGNTASARGVPLLTAAHWDTGVQVSTGWRFLDVAAALTDGAPSRPRPAGGERHPQVAARIGVAPLTGLTLGTSAARGRFLDRTIEADGDRARQDVFGLDAEYSRGHGLIRSEIVLSRWRIPLPAESGESASLHAAGLFVEGRYTVRPGAYVATRVEHLTFNHIGGATARRRWEAPVSRVELGGGYHLQRNLLAKAALQMNWRDGGRVTHARLLAGQLLYWF